MNGLRALLEHRVTISLALSLVAGVVGPSFLPLTADSPILALVEAARPTLFRTLSHGYVAIWCSTSFLFFTVVSTMIYILAARGHAALAMHRLPPYPPIASRRDPYLVLGELHHQTRAERAPMPAWLTVPERGLYTGVAIVGAIGSGKTSACMYPYVQQLLAYRANDPRRRIGGLILEVKGDFCEQVRGILTACGRSADYVEISLTSRYRYNPLHNDLEAYALAFGIATLMTNLFGRGKEPFWQQASTNLVKFVILLHQVLDDYVTLFQVYEHVINPDKLRARISAGDMRFGAHSRRVVVDKTQILEQDALNAWTWHNDSTGKTTWTHWSADLERALTAANTPWTLQESTPDAREIEKAAQFEAVKRWFEDDWTRIEPKLRTSIVEGVSVFLSLFDDSPAVKHTFCPPKDAYDPMLNADRTLGIPLPPLSELIEQGKVVALNFPAAMNPALARALGTMLKQDFQRAVLNRS